MNLPQPLTRQEHPMTRTYRDPDVVRFRFWYLSFFLLVPIFSVAQLALGWVPFTKGAVLVAALGSIAFLLTSYYLYRFVYYGRCSEIRLSDDGTCELETKRRVIRVHVNQIRSVRFSPAGDESSESYTIRYEGGKLHVDKRMSDFPDFLTRLKGLNPAVDLTSFPAEVWPGLGGRAADPPGPLRSFVQRLLFPLIVIVLLVSLASHTLLGK
jgi:hypothetical protein